VTVAPKAGAAGLTVTDAGGAACIYFVFTAGQCPARSHTTHTRTPFTVTSTVPALQHEHRTRDSAVIGYPLDDLAARC
jgi:hypothetical protein